jgi:acetylglutamate kinase
MRNLLFKFFEKVGKSQEIELFIQRFKVIPREQFAVLRVSYRVIETQMVDLAESLAFMQHMGIFPVVILDLKAASVSDYVAGKRFAPAAVQFIDALSEFGGTGEIVTHAVDATSPRPSNWTFDLDRLKEVLDQDALPIISPFATRNRRRIFINAEELSHLLIQELNPIKYILITEDGGILDKSDQILPFLNLSQRKEWSHVKDEMKPMLREIRVVLKKAPDCAAIFTSPQNLLKEIFTIKGSGTFVKKYVIAATSKVADLDLDRLKQLLEDAFDKHLVDDFFEEKIKMILFEKNYEGVAIIKKVRGIPYLDKIAVAKTSEGTGLGRSLWQKVFELYPKLIWRSAPSNPMASFYLRECDGCIKFAKWHVYWRNLEDHEIFPAVKKVVEIRSTMRQKDG